MEPASPANAPKPPVAFAPVVTAWPRSAQIVVAFLCGVTVTLLVMQFRSLLPGFSKPTILQHSSDAAYRINLNQADRAELLQLPGVGDSLSSRLEQYRREHGDFQEIEQLRRVKGIGPARLAQLSDWVTVEQRGADVAPMDETYALSPLKKGSNKPTAKKPPKGSDITEPIDINRATATELQRIPGVGPTTAQRIIDTRTKAPFETVDDLRRVPRLGAKTLDKLRPYVTVSHLPSH